MSTTAYKAWLNSLAPGSIVRVSQPGSNVRRLMTIRGLYRQVYGQTQRMVFGMRRSRFVFYRFSGKSPFADGRYIEPATVSEIQSYGRSESKTKLTGIRHSPTFLGPVTIAA